MFKRIALSFALITTSPVFAQGITGEEIIGGVIGGIIGNQFGGGSGKVAMTAIGAVVGTKIGKEHERQNNEYRPPIAGQTPMRQQNAMEACIGDGFYNGEYNPRAAAMYCRGLQDAAEIRQSRIEGEAYRAGVNTHTR